MKVEQIYELMNDITTEMLGENAIIEEDLSNVISLGKQFEDVVGLDNYVRKLNDKVGRMVFVDRIYKGRVPSVLMDGWEYGSILEKVSPDLPNSHENKSWDLQDGVTYGQDIFYKPSVTVSCWNDRITFEIPISITQMQVKSSFNSAVQLNAFISMLYTAVNNAMTLNLDALIMRTINNFVGETLFDEYKVTNEGETTLGPINAKTTVKAVNLLYEYNQLLDDENLEITAKDAIINPDFIRFATLRMSNYIDRMKVMSKLFNIGGKERFTPEDKLHVVMLSDFKNGANVYLQSDTFNEQYTALPNAETVPFWQGSGTNFDFSDVSKINIKTSSGNNINFSGLLAVMFDRDALGVTNMNPRVTTHYNAKAEFWNEWHKYDAGYFNDTNENMVIFFVA